MTGIVERLRNPMWVHSLNGSPVLEAEQTKADMAEAADLIETLTVALAEATEREAEWSKGRRPFQNQNEVIAGQVKRIDDLHAALTARRHHVSGYRDDEGNANFPAQPAPATRDEVKT